MSHSKILHNVLNTKCLDCILPSLEKKGHRPAPRFLSLTAPVPAPSLGELQTTASGETAPAPTADVPDRHHDTPSVLLLGERDREDGERGGKGLMFLFFKVCFS